MPTSSASAVSAFSPPESSSTFCSFLPGGEATISSPLSAWFSSSVSRRNACPPWKSRVNTCAEVLVDPRKCLVELGARNLVDLLDRLLRVFDRLHQVLALRFEEAVPLGRLLVLVERHHVHRAHLLDALAQRRGRSLLRQPALRRRCAQSPRRRAAPAASAFTSVRQLASRCSRSERSLATSLERPLRSSRNWSSAARPVFNCVSIAASCWRNVLRLRRDRLRLGQRLGAQCRQFLLALRQLRALANALLALCFCRGALLLDGQHAPLEVGVQPVDALECRLRAAPPLFQPGQLRGHLRRFLLQRLRASGAASPVASAALQAPLRPSRAPPPAARLLRASAR